MEMNEYLKKYPWLKGYDQSPDQNEPSCALNWIPKGWVIAFGEQMCEELDIALRKTDEYDKAYIVEAKEKYGSMRMCIYPSNEEIERILMKYEAISEHICMHCAAVDVPMLNIGRWLSVYCRDCYSEINNDDRYKPYDEVIDGDAEMPAKIKWGQFSKERGHENFEMDISETTQKIRERYAERKANGEFKDSQCDDSEDNYYGA
jgi:hypothetical protein